MLTAASLIIAKSYKQPKYISPGEWITKLWYIQTVKYYSVLKRNELSGQENT